MDTVLLLTLLLFVALRVAMVAIVPPVPSKSRFELQRLAEIGDEWAKRRRRRLRFWKDIISLARLVDSLLLIAVLLIAITLFGWIVGVLVGVATLPVAGLLARTTLIQKRVRQVYRKAEAGLLGFIARHQKVLWWLRLPVPELLMPPLHSKAELEHLVETSHDAFTAEEKTTLLHSIRFTEKRVKDSMTLRPLIETVKKSEILGPLVLDGLHKTGHSCFPVTYGTIDQVVGVLYLADVLTIDTSRKHTALVETAMDKRVLYIHQDRSLVEALSILLEAHRHVLIVADDEGKTAGLLTLGDIIKALFGYRLTHQHYESSDQSAATDRR